MSGPFLHSGHIGDVIYSLPTVRAMGGGAVLLRECHHAVERGSFSVADIRGLLPLLEAQDYCRGSGLWSFQPVIPLDLFRSMYRLHTNLADQSLFVFGIPSSERDRAWIEAQPRRVAEVVMSRSARYRGHPAFWKAAMETYRSRAVFVGTEDEHLEISKFGKVPWYPTETMLDVAEVISGCEVFVGNQSAPYAVAEGMKKTAVLEVYGLDENCRFDRAGVFYAKDAPELAQYISHFPGPELAVPGWP